MSALCLYPLTHPKKMRAVFGSRREGGFLFWGTLVICGFTVAMPGQVHAAELYSNGGLNVDLNTLLQYSTAYRVNDPSQTLLNIPNTNDGDQNFQHGFI